jgi:hypothetical protein
MLKSIHIYCTCSSVSCFGACCFCCLCGQPMFSCVVFRVTTLSLSLFSLFIRFANASNPYARYTFLHICSLQDFSFLLFLSVSHDSCSREQITLHLHYITFTRHSLQHFVLPSNFNVSVLPTKLYSVLVFPRKTPTTLTLDVLCMMYIWIPQYFPAYMHNSLSSDAFRLMRGPSSGSTQVLKWACI